MTTPRPGSRARGGDEEEGGEGGSLRWVLTYADMITLLLLFFILLFAKSSLSKIKLQELSQALSSRFLSQSVIGQAPGPSVVPGASGGRAPTRGSGATPQRSSSPASTAALRALARRLQATVTNRQLSADVTVQTLSSGVVITIRADYLFPSGHAAISAPGQVLIQRLGRDLTQVPNPVVVLGATDSVPIHTPRYPSNWQLGAMRAANVTAVLSNVPGFLATRLLSATTSKYHPIATNRTAAGRAQNRRVVLWVVRAHTLVTSLLGGSSP